MKKLVLVLLIASIAWAQNILDTTSDNFKTLITFTVVDQSVDQVLNVLAEMADVNLVMGEETKEKKVSLDLKDIPIKDALDLVVRATDLSYQIVDNAIIVADEEKIERPIGLSTSVYDLQYADAEKVQGMLADITEKVKVDIIGNRLIYQADPKRAKEIERVLLRIDRPLQQVLFKAKILEVGTENNDRFGLDWSKLSNYSTTIREGSAVDWGTWDIDDESGRWEWTYDTSQPPVRDLNGDYSDMGPVTTRPDAFGSQTSSGFNDVWHRVVRQEYELTLDFKMRDNDATVLAEPSIATLNNSEADIHLGDIVPYTVTTIEQGTSKQTVQKENIGVKMTIKPIINEENDITVKVEAEVSSIFGWVGPNNEIPWIKVRRASTNVRVRDGQTIVIGGMTLEDETYTVDKLPLLGQIPFLGYLFQHHVMTKKATNLIIEITPYIMIDGEVIIDEKSDIEEIYRD